MSNKFASSKRAIAECDICGFRYKRKQLKEIIVKDTPTQIMACQECWNPSHPQLKLGSFPVEDPRAIRNPRPDFTGYPQSRAQVVDAVGFQMVPRLGVGSVLVY